MLIALLTTDRFNEPLDPVGPNLAPNQLVVCTPANDEAISSAWMLPTAQQARARRSTTATIAVELGTRDVLPLTAPVVPTDLALEQVKAGSEQGTIDIYVATPALLRHYGIKAGAVSPGTGLITSRPGLQGAPSLLLQYGNFTLPNPVLK